MLRVKRVQIAYVLLNSTFAFLIRLLCNLNVIRTQLIIEITFHYSIVIICCLNKSDAAEIF